MIPTRPEKQKHIPTDPVPVVRHSRFHRFHRVNLIRQFRFEVFDTSCNAPLTAALTVLARAGEPDGVVRHFCVCLVYIVPRFSYSQ